jgi:hypothetical protein
MRDEEDDTVILEKNHANNMLLELNEGRNAWRHARERRIYSLANRNGILTHKHMYIHTHNKLAISEQRTLWVEMNEKFNYIHLYGDYG